MTEPKKKRRMFREAIVPNVEGCESRGENYPNGIDGCECLPCIHEEGRKSALIWELIESGQLEPTTEQKEMLTAWEAIDAERAARDASPDDAAEPESKRLTARDQLPLFGGAA